MTPPVDPVELARAGDAMIAAAKASAEALAAAEKRQRSLRWVTWGTIMGVVLLFQAVRVFG